MRSFVRLSFAFTVVALLVGAGPFHGVLHGQFPQDRGQNVIPVFEGWQRNEDASFNLYFGLYNRNYKEEVDIPIGPDNSFSPGPVDRGQPTHFYPRRQEFTFAVRVPPDFGKQELVWTLTSRGRTEKTYGSLNPAYEVDRELIVKNQRGVGAFRSNIIKDDQPPSVEIAPVPAVTLPSTVTLTASVTDDGLPPPPRGGLRIAWAQYRGTGMVTFETTGFTPVKDGRASTIATFSEPGTYVLRATVTDGLLDTHVNFTIMVKPPPSGGRQ